MKDKMIVDEMERAAEERRVFLRKEKKRRKRKVRFIRFGLLLGLLVIVYLGFNMDVIMWKLQFMGCPSEITEFVMKYPEAVSLAKDYQKCHNLEPQKELYPGDFSGRIPLFMQWDSRWGYQHYGDGFTGTTGCGPTSLAMVYTGLTGNMDISPARMAEWADENGYYVAGVGSSWDLMTEGASALGLYVTPLDIDQSAIASELWNGKTVICSMNAGDFTRTGHFIVLTDIDEQGMISVNDCNSRIRSEQKWELSYIIGQMAGAWSYEAA